MEKQLSNVQRAEKQTWFANPSSSVIRRPLSSKASCEDQQDSQTSDRPQGT